MITACHTLIYADDAEATRAFLRDVLQLPHVDAGGPEPGWLIFRTSPSEVAPTRRPASTTAHRVTTRSAHLRRHRRDHGRAPRARGRVSSGPDDRGYGLVAMLQVPGADDVQIYEPRHTVAHSL